jgi:hypothetical protein
MDSFISPQSRSLGPDSLDHQAQNEARCTRVQDAQPYELADPRDRPMCHVRSPFRP